MAKRKSIWDVSQDEIKQDAQKEQQKAMGGIPEKQEEEEITAPKAEKLKIIYVDTKHHTQAKSTAALRGMKLMDYIEYLIEQDKKVV